MIKTKSIVPLIVGLGVAFYAIKMGVNLIKKAQGDTTDGVAVVVTRDLVPVGVKLDAEMLRVVAVPESMAPDAYFSSVKDVVGRVTTWSVLPGGRISEEVLAPPGSLPGLGVKIPDGYRAVAVEVDEYSSVAGFLVPGSWVDIVAVMRTTRRNKRETISRTILEEIQVAAVGQLMADPEDPGAQLTQSVTLLVKPKDAAALHLAASQGDIRLALRNREDNETGERGFATEENLLDEEWSQTEGEAKKEPVKPDPKPPISLWAGLGKAAAARDAARKPPKSDPITAAAQAREPVLAVAPGPKPWTITLMRGNQREELTFDSNATVARQGHSNQRIHGLLNSTAKKGRYPDVSDHVENDAEESDPTDGEVLPGE